MNKWQRMAVIMGVLATVSGTLAVTPENGRSIFLSTTAQRAAKPRLTEPGAYLVTAAHGGQTFSLTFRVAQQTS